MMKVLKLLTITCLLTYQNTVKPLNSGYFQIVDFLEGNGDILITQL